MFQHPPTVSQEASHGSLLDSGVRPLPTWRTSQHARMKTISAGCSGPLSENSSPTGKHGKRMQTPDLAALFLAGAVYCRATYGNFSFRKRTQQNNTKLQARPCRSHQMICVSPGQSTANNTCGATFLHWRPPSHPKGFEFENFIKMTLESGHSNKTLQG